MSMKDLSKAGDRTRLINAGRDPSKQSGTVNPPLHRASTIIMDAAEDLYAPHKKTYGLQGFQVHEALEAALCELEHANHCILVESGLLACTLPIFALVGHGEHILVPSNSYGPIHRYCNRSLQRTGGSVSYYDPDIGDGISDLIQDNTSLIILESPGSLTFEIPDIRAIVAAAQARNIPTALDNCWSSGIYLNPIDLGVDIVIQATTKFIAGHSDSLSGALLTHDEKLATKLRDAKSDLGLNMAPEDANIVLRGIRTLPIRMQQHAQSGLEIAQWLQSRPEVQNVLYPALPDNPYHALWKRDFTGACGLFSIILQPCSQQTVHTFLNALDLFGLGFSYGGYESLAVDCDIQIKRRPDHKPFAGPVVRFHIGLENVEDLKADLEKGFAALSPYLG